jgi:BirA family biotin operon repressor/biotin-[acetyl-CoA-carboxylase] ligase
MDKMDKWELLVLLKANCGEYVSGEDISKKFNVTRAAVWKNINELKSLGYEILSKTNNGYMLLPPFDILNAHELESGFAAKNLPYKIIYKTTVDSTNNEAKRLQNTDGNAVVAALGQTGGRGRYNRQFSSKQNMGIYFTVRINSYASGSASETISIDDITFYPLIAALSVCVAVKKICGTDLEIKWPNDLLYKDKKICGILTEASIEAESHNIAYVIVGIGVNINNSPEDFPDTVRDKATSLKIISGKNYDRVEILCEILDSFTKLASKPRGKMLGEYRRHLITGRKISFMQNNMSYSGTVYDINGNGNLIVTLEDNTRVTVRSGEINFINS